MASYTDTIFLFREKTVDFMIPPGKKSKNTGWTNPRTIACSNYYRFTNSQGLDSVSDVCNHHFSWSDWMSVPSAKIPKKLASTPLAYDTINGKYSIAEKWVKNGDMVQIDVNVLADAIGKKWVPNLNVFFRKGFDFEKFKVSYIFDNVLKDTITPLDLSRFSFEIESKGRGHSMFRFTRKDEPFYVGTSADIYILEKELLTRREARKWERYDFSRDGLGIFYSPEASELDPEIIRLMDRVEALNKNDVRLDYVPDENLKSRYVGINRNKFGKELANLLKDAIGIKNYLVKKHNKKEWDNFRHDNLKNNNRSALSKIGEEE